jgi:hypothetical protein
MPMTLSGDGTITGLVAGGLPDATVIDGDLSLTANSAPIKTALNASGDAPIYACRAWVNFNGTGAVAIRASGNVSSITDNGTGDYTVNFTTALPDADYSISCTSVNGSGATASFAIFSLRSDISVSGDPLTKTTTQVRIGNKGMSGSTPAYAAFDSANCNVAIFR